MSWTFPAPTQFWWLPVAGYRHAIWDRDRTATEGTPVHTLCDETHTQPTVGDYDWFWPSCPPCWEATGTLVGLRSGR